MNELIEQQRYKELQKRRKEALSALTKDNEANLSDAYAMRPYAMRVMATFGPHLDIEAYERNEFSKSALLGWQRRAWNGILCAEKVLPFWTEAALMESNVFKELHKAKGVVKSGNPTLENPVIELDPSDLEVEGEFQADVQPPEIQRAIYAYLTAEFAVRFTYTDIESPFELDIDYEDPNVHNYEPHREPNVFHASFAFAGGEAWGCSYDDKKARKEFWLWWLNEAVPASWELRDI